jgi:uncharacterized protein YjiS (DUF1127 family)
VQPADIDLDHGWPFGDATEFSATDATTVSALGGPAMSTQSLFHEVDFVAHGPRHGLALGLLARYSAWRRRRRELVELYRMSDRDLSDIGLTRCDLPAIAAGALGRNA